MRDSIFLTDFTRESKGASGEGKLKLSCDETGGAGTFFGVAMDLLLMLM